MSKFFNSIINIYIQIYGRTWSYYMRKGRDETTADKRAMGLLTVSVIGNTYLITSIISLVFRLIGYGYDNYKIIIKCLFAFALLVSLYFGVWLRDKGINKRFNKIPKERLKSAWFLWIYGILNFSLAFLIAWLQGKYLGK